MKALIVILGAGASGKSTLTRALCGADGHEDMVFYNINGKAEKAKFATFPNGSAIAGNIKNGSDAISSMEARAELIKGLLNAQEVQFVITDGVRSSKKWDVDFAQTLNCAVVYVYLDITLEENLKRLVQRRTAAGKTEMTPKTYDNMLAFRDRAYSVWKAAEESLPSTKTRKYPVKLVRLNEGMSAGDWAKEVKLVILRMFEQESQAQARAKLLKDTNPAPAHV